MLVYLPASVQQLVQSVRQRSGRYSLLSSSSRESAPRWYCTLRVTSHHLHMCAPTSSALHQRYSTPAWILSTTRISWRCFTQVLTMQHTGKKYIDIISSACLSNGCLLSVSIGSVASVAYRYNIVPTFLHSCPNTVHAAIRTVYTSIAFANWRLYQLLSASTLCYLLYLATWWQPPLQWTLSQR